MLAIINISCLHFLFTSGTGANSIITIYDRRIHDDDNDAFVFNKSLPIMANNCVYKCLWVCLLSCFYLYYTITIIIKRIQSIWIQAEALSFVEHFGI